MAENRDTRIEALRLLPSEVVSEVVNGKGSSEPPPRSPARRHSSIVKLPIRSNRLPERGPHTIGGFCFAIGLGGRPRVVVAFVRLSGSWLPCRRPSEDLPGGASDSWIPAR